MRIRVLLVEGDTTYARTIVEVLLEDVSSDWSVEVVGRLDGAIAHLHRESFGVIVLDLDLPDSLGADTFDRLSAAAPHLPIVILTSRASKQAALAALREGAEEYVVKEAAEARLLPRMLRHAIERHIYRESLRTTEARFRSLVERAVQAILIHVDGRIRLANQAFADLVGVDRWSDLIEQSIWPFIFADDHSRVAGYTQARAEGRPAPVRYELRIVRAGRRGALGGLCRERDCVVRGAG